MKVVFLSSDHVTPAFAAKYASALKEGGAAVEIITARFSREDFDQCMVKFDGPIHHFGAHPHIGRRLSRLPLLWRLNPLISRWTFARRTGRNFRRAVMNSGAKTIIACDPDDLALAFECSDTLGAEVIYAPFEYFPEHSEASVSQRQRWLKIETQFAARVRAWISLGDKLSSEYRRVYSLGSTVHTVYNSLACNIGSGNLALRARLGLKLSDIVVLYQGVIARKRGLYEVLAAMKALPQSVHFVALGFGEEFEAFSQAVNDQGAQSNVHVLPAVPQNELMNYTLDADIGIIPIQNYCESYRYCNPAKLFEFVAAGLPLIVSDLDQLAWFVKKHALGEVFPSGDSQAIAQAIRRLAQDAEYRQVCTANCHTVHRSEACWEIQSERLRRAVFEPSRWR